MSLACTWKNKLASRIPSMIAAHAVRSRLIRYSVGGGVLSFHLMVDFEPEPTKAAFREQLLRVIEPSGQEPGCLRMDVFESVRQPYVFAIHSEWTDEAAFELHSSLSHTTHFI